MSTEVCSSAAKAALIQQIGQITDRFRTVRDTINQRLGHKSKSAQMALEVERQIGRLGYVVEFDKGQTEMEKDIMTRTQESLGHIVADLIASSDWPVLRGGNESLGLDTAVTVGGVEYRVVFDFIRKK